MFPFKEEGMELAVEQEMIRCVSHISMQEPLQQHIALFLNKIINTNDRSLWYGYLKPLNDYFSELNLTQFIYSSHAIMQIYATIKAHFDDKKFVWSDSCSTKIGMYHDFLDLMNLLFIHIIVIHPKFATIDAQTELFDEFKQQLPHTTSPYSSRKTNGQSVLFVWVYILSELQKTQLLPATLRPLEHRLPTFQYISRYFFEYAIDYSRYLKQIEVLKQPLSDFYQSGLPLDVIGKEYFCDSENGATIYMAGVPALWPLKVLDSLNSMPEPQKKLWLQVWQHTASNNLKVRDFRNSMPEPERTQWLQVWRHNGNVLPSDDWLQAASQLASALQPSFSKQINTWLVEIVAEVSRKDNTFSDNNEHIVCGLLWFASFGEVKVLQKVVTKYAKFFYGPYRSGYVVRVATYCLEKWQILI